MALTSDQFLSGGAEDASVALLIGMPDDPIDHLTRIPWYLRCAFRIDRLPVVGWVFGTVGGIWLPVIVATTTSVLLSYQVVYPALCWTIGSLVSVQVVGGLVAHGAKLHREFAAGVEGVLDLRRFLDWMHAQVFSKNTNTRITIMVPVKGRNGPVLRVFLRPSAFPSRSDTELAIQCNTGQIEGAAGVSYCEGGEQRIEISVDPGREKDYAQQSYMTVEKVRTLTRKARFYLAHPIENTTGPHVGVLVVDHAKHGRIVDAETKAACDRAEEQTRLLVQWVALQLRAIPDRIRKRA